MKERFEGDGRPNLVDALKRQEFVNGNVDLANAMSEQGNLIEFGKGDKLILEEGEDDDIFLNCGRLCCYCRQRERNRNAKGGSACR